MEDSLWHTLTDWHVKTPMGITAENLAEKYDISRQDADEFGLLSQQRWKAGQWEKTYISGLMQDCGSSSALALEIPHSCTKAQ